jgi:2-polyprenyl-3-methyl-5-hydroxy-6-metoxy-1,4-benzoquinol methylase
MPELSEYRYRNEAAEHTASYLLTEVQSVLREHGARRIFEIGCGNAANAHALSAQYDIVGIDSSESGIAIARSKHPELRIEQGSAYEDLRARFGTFDTVLSLEVIEHLYDPRCFLNRAKELMEPGGTLVLSTPYHSYLKNLLLAATGRMDAHFTALWDGGHIKFFSPKTLCAMLREQGFRPVAFRRCGRIPALAKSMIVVAKKVSA